MKENSMLKSIMLVGVGIAIGSSINAVSSSGGEEDKTKSTASMPPPPPGPYRSIQPGSGSAAMPQASAPLYPPVNMATPPWQQAQRQMMPPVMQHPAWARPAPRPEWTTKRPERPQRPEWAKRPEPQQRPAWAQQAQRPEWAKRPQRPQRPEWAKRPEPQQRPAWAQPAQRPGWAKRPQRPEWARRPQANAWAPPPMTYAYGYPPVPAYIAPRGYGAGGGWSGWGQVRR